MNTVELLRHVADNIDNKRVANHGLLFSGGSCAAPVGLLDINIIWNMASSYTLAPATHTVNGFEVAKSISVQPSEGDITHLADQVGVRYHNQNRWTGSNFDYRMFNRGLLFATPEDAAANAKAMLGIDPTSEES